MASKASAACLAAIFATSPAYAAQTISPDTTIKGRLEKGDRKMQKFEWVDSYTYVGRAGEELWIPLSSHPSVSFSLDVLGPGFAATNVQSRGIRLPQDGKYTIAIHGFAAGDYQFTVHRVTTAPSPAALSVGQTVQGGFTTTDAQGEGYRARDLYAYTARAGESVVFRFEGQSPSAAVVLKGPNHFLRSGYNQGDGEPIQVGAVFPADGVYELSVAGHGGNYSLSATSRDSAMTAPATRLNLGDSATLRYGSDLPTGTSGNFANVFTVAAERGERIVVLRTAAEGVRVWGPDGKAVATKDQIAELTPTYKAGDPLLSSVEFAAPAAGDYRIEAHVRSNLPADQANLRIVTPTESAKLLAQARGATDNVKAARRQQVAELMREGERLMNNGDYYGSISKFIEAAGLDRDATVPAYFGAGLAAYRQGGTYGYLAAKGYFETVLIHDPDNAAARTNRDLAAQADADYQRNQQVAYEQAQAQRRQENSQYFSNMLNAFAAGVDLGNQINAANAPPPPLPSAPALQPMAAAPGRSAPPTGTTQIADPANIRYGCVARSVVTVKQRNLDQLVNNCSEPLSVGYFYASGGFGSMQMHDRTPKYLDSGQYTRLTICVQGTLKYDGPNIWCGPKPMDIRSQ